jgi:Toprim domain
MIDIAQFHALGIPVPASARGEIRTTCPQCSDGRRKKRDPCLSANLDTGLFLCHHCEWKGCAGGAQTRGVQVERPAPQPNDKQRRTLQRRWDEAAPLVPGDPVTRYLASRGICLPANAWPPCLRYHAALYYHDDENDYWGTHPAMLARVVDATGQPVSLHRTYLTAEATKATVGTARKVMTPVVAGATSGGAIRLYRPGPVLAVAEGIETALAVRLMTGLPVWAAGSAGAIGALHVPPEVELVVVCADHDADPKVLALGAEKLAQRLVQEGRRAKILVPAQVATDWNDVLQDKTAARLTMAGIEATPDVAIEGPEPPGDDAPVGHHPPLVHHVVPDYILTHPDPRVRAHWQRIYRKTAMLHKAPCERTLGTSTLASGAGSLGW